MATKKNTPERRVPVPSKSAFKTEEKRPTEFWCCRCPKHFTKQQGNFPSSKSAIYAANNGYLPICKTCLSELYLYYCDTLDSPIEAARRICMEFDIYFDKDIITNVLATSTKDVAITTYIGRVVTSSGRNKSYDDTLKEDIEEIERRNALENPEDKEAREAEILKRGREMWGIDLTVSDYEFLNNEFEDWNTSCVVDGKTRESLVKDLCVIKLQQNKALAVEDVDTYNKLSTQYQKTLTTAELTPKQVSDAERATEKPMGVMIAMFENDRPIPEPDPEWKDVDGIMKLILVFFIGHLCKMLGLKNKYSKMYEDEMKTLSVDVPEEIQDGDSEDIFDYLLENGFSNSGHSNDSEGDINAE